MTWDDLGLKLAELLLPVVAALLITLIGYGVAYLQRRIQRMNNEVAREALAGALSEAERVAKDAINATNQKLVDDLKTKAADGKLTSDEKAAAMRAAKDYFVGHITAESADILQAALGPVNEWLEDLLEAKIGEGKAIQKAVTAAASPLSAQS